MVAPVVAAAGKMALGYAVNKAKGYALNAGKSIVKKVAGTAYAKARGIFAGKSKSGAPAGKAQVRMVNRGRIKEHGGQAGAYIPNSLANLKKEGFASRAAVYPTKKLMTENRALSYGGAATMKTRR